ncbi:MAG: sensor histidine kinase [Nocardiopsaceae bacterium]|jgi:signal transduction histidine kinase|nr:sensor histidine kinase [Nocardiopsaceae bacterium]
MISALRSWSRAAAARRHGFPAAAGAARPDGPGAAGPDGPPAAGPVTAVAPGIRPWLTDALIAVVVTALSLAWSYGGQYWHTGQPAMNAAGYVILAAGGLSLTARRRYPASVLAVTLAAALVAGSAGHAAMPWLPLIVAFFTAVVARRRAAAVASLVIGYLVTVWPPWLIGAHGHTSTTFALALLCGLLVLFSAAELIRSSLARRAAQQHIRQEELRRRAGEERMRMARDLHDVVAHNISVINVQANTALHLIDRRPEHAREALATINEVSKQALVELRSVLGVLRGADEEATGAPRAPAPGLGRLDELAGATRATGLTVKVNTEGDPEPLSAAADLAAYRIIQEALTNSARHSGGTQATVTIRYRDQDVELEVDDDGTAGAGRPTGTRPAAGGTGNGIAGMTERAQALGGWLWAGPRPGGGFRVTARLPVQGEAR